MEKTALRASASGSFALLAAALLFTSSSLIEAATGQAQKTPPDERAGSQRGLPVEIFSGRVVTRAGKPIAKASVEVGGKTASTDDKGTFRIALPRKRTKEQARYVLNIRKDGFGMVSRVYFKGIDGGRWTMAGATLVSIDPTIVNTVVDVRAANACKGSLSSQADWSQYPNRRTPYLVDAQGRYAGDAPAEALAAVAFAESAMTCNEGGAVTIPANALVDAQGNAPGSRVNVSISTVDIYEPGAMPGDDTVAIGSQSGYMVTFGAAMVTATADGRPLQLKKGASAALNIPVNALQRKNPKLPASLRLLVYDEAQGVWRDMGEGKLNAQKTAYSANLTHLSFLNFDLVKTGQSCIRVDSSAIAEDYQLEVSLVYEGNAIIKTKDFDNTPEKTHVVFNLPTGTAVTLRGFRTGGIVGATLITDSVTATTAAQTPSTPNHPDYPYGACNSQVALTPFSSVPLLSGPATSYGTFTLSWDYTWPPGLVSNQDGYELEKSTTSATSGFGPYYHTNNTSADDHRTHVDFSITEPTGTYWYRVRGVKLTVPGPWSNVRSVVVNTAGTVAAPRTLRVINDLDDRTSAFAQFNGIVRVRIATTCDQAIAGTGERLTVSDTGSLPGDVIPPRYLQDTSRRDFDVTGITLTAANTYCVYIQAGWWDAILNTETFEFLYWQRTDTMVKNCFGADGAFKNNIILIIQPFFEPEVIRASDWLPQWATWQGHPTCP